MIDAFRAWYLGLSDDGFMLLILGLAVVGLACSLLGIGKRKEVENESD